MGRLRIIITLLANLFILTRVSATPNCNVKNYGARGDGKTLDTLAIQKAVNACQGTSGIVQLPAGKYVSGTVILGSDMTFQLEAGATLWAVRDVSQYPDLSPNSNNTQLKAVRKALLYANGADHLTIQGPGTIYGSGDWSTWSGDTQPTTARPVAILAFQTSNLLLSNVQVKNAAMWAVVLMETANSGIDGLNVNTPDGVTHDGIDIVDGHDISISNATVISGDDSICLKSGIPSGLQRVTVQNSHILGSSVANGLKFGTASAGSLSSVTFDTIDVSNVRQAAMALESVDGAHIQDITFKNVTVEKTGSLLYVILGWRGDQGHPRVGSIDQVSFQNITGNDFTQNWGAAVSGTTVAGTTYAPTNISFANMNLTLAGDSSGRSVPAPSEYQGEYPDPRLWGELPASGLYFRHVKRVSFSQVRLNNSVEQDVRPTMIPVFNSTASTFFDAP